MTTRFEQPPEFRQASGEAVYLIDCHAPGVLMGVFMAGDAIVRVVVDSLDDEVWYVPEGQWEYVQ